MEKLDYFHVAHPEPHIGRTKELLKKYPEIRTLFGHTPSTAVWAICIVGVQFSLAIGLENAAWWVVIFAAWILVAFLEHALFVIIHYCAHNLVF